MICNGRFPAHTSWYSVPVQSISSGGNRRFSLAYPTQASKGYCPAGKRKRRICKEGIQGNQKRRRAAR